MRSFVAFAALAACSGNALAGVNLFENPGFESGAFVANGDNTMVVVPGNSAISNWQVVSADVAWLSTPNPFNGLSPSEGTKFIDLTSYSGGTGAIAQTIATIPGQTYHIEFDQGSGVYGNSYLRVLASDDSGQISSADFTDIATNSSRWDRHSFDFVARQSLSTVTFGHYFGTGNYSGLDNVSATLVPAPGAMALLGLGAAVTRSRSRRR